MVAETIGAQRINGLAAAIVRAGGVATLPTAMAMLGENKQATSRALDWLVKAHSPSMLPSDWITASVSLRAIIMRASSDPATIVLSAFTKRVRKVAEYCIAAQDRRRIRRLRSLRLPLWVLMLLAIGATLVFARALLIPLVLAAFIALALNPVVALLVFFFLSYGRDVAAHLVTATPGFSYRRVALRLIRGIQREFSRYLLTVSVINVCLGLVTAAMLWALGVPNPMLWGGMATLLNFMPYVGAVTTTLVLLFVGLVHFASPWQALAPAACFAAAAALEGNVITPMILGSRLRLSPLAILVWLLIWGWLWGIPGALLAVPLLTCLKLTTESLPGWQWFARMVER